MSKVKISKVLNMRSDDRDLKTTDSKKKKMEKIEKKTFNAEMPCCKCGDQWGLG